MKEETTINDLTHIIDLFTRLGIDYWLDGGWGVDALYGKQTRLHHDIDIDFDSNYLDTVLNILAQDGYIMSINDLPVRAELYSDSFGYIDIHPFIIEQDSIKQVNPDGGYFVFEKDWFSKTSFLNKEIPCISLQGQFIFHSGYELREKDRLDLERLNELKYKINRK